MAKKLKKTKVCKVKVWTPIEKDHNRELVRRTAVFHSKKEYNRNREKMSLRSMVC